MSNRRTTAVLPVPEPGARRDMAARAALDVPGVIVGPLGQAVMTALADAEQFDLFDSPPVAALLGAGTDGRPMLTADQATALAAFCAVFADCHPLLAGAAHELVQG